MIDRSDKSAAFDEERNPVSSKRLSANANNFRHDTIFVLLRLSSVVASGLAISIYSNFRISIHSKSLRGPFNRAPQALCSPLYVTLINRGRPTRKRSVLLVNLSSGTGFRTPV